MPGGLDLGFSGPVIARPCLGSERRELGDVEPDDRAGRAMNQSGVLGSLGLWSQPQANRSDARPACPHCRIPSCPTSTCSTQPSSIDGTRIYHRDRKLADSQLEKQGRTAPRRNYPRYCCIFVVARTRPSAPAPKLGFDSKE